MQHLHNNRPPCLTNVSGKDPRNRPIAEGFDEEKEDLTMRKTMRIASLAMGIAMTGGLLLSMAPTASAQRVSGRVIIVERRPFFPYYYDYYPYPPYYVANYGEIKIATHQKDASVYIDGGFAARIRDAKRFALRPGNHNVELRDSDGQTIAQEEVAVTLGHTTKLHFS